MNVFEPGLTQIPFNSNWPEYLSECTYLLSKIHGSGLPTGRVTEVAHCNPWFRLELSDLNEIFGQPVWDIGNLARIPTKANQENSLKSDQKH